MYKVYYFLTYLISPFSYFFFKYRLLKKKENYLRFKEKLGIYTIKNENKTLWFHASSLGEFKSIIPLILFYEKKGKKILITTSTLSSADFFKKKFENYKNIIHQFAPIDIPFVVQKFLKHWKPEVAIFTESELWPNLIYESKKNSKLILINARLSKKTFSRWKTIRSFAQNIFNKFDLILSQSQETKKFIESFNIKNIKFIGNLKFCYTFDEVDNDTFDLNNTIDNKWIAMSTHDGEEQFIMETIKCIKQKKILSQCILIPRHVNRIGHIINLIRNNNLTYQLESQKIKDKTLVDFFILDSYGRAQEAFKKINIVFMGGSIVNHGGQNPLEAAREGCKIYHGPNIQNFEEIFEFLKQNNVSTLIINEKEFADQLINQFKKSDDREIFKKKLNQISEKILIDHLNCLNALIN